MIKIPQLLFGTFQYRNKEELKPIIYSAYENGITGFDTSPSYYTEEMLGEVLKDLSERMNIGREKLFIQDKIDGWQMQLSKGNIIKFADESLLKLGTDYVDVLFVHWPFPDYLNETWETFSKLKKEGKVRFIGLSNVRERHMVKIIKETGIRPDVIQIERHPLRTCTSDIDYCNKENILVQAYSPVCRMDKRIVDSPVLQSIAKKYNKSIGQVILRWHIDTGVTPVFMTKKAGRIKENTDLFDFYLTDSEVSSVNSLNMNYKIFVESVCCPGI